MIDEHEAESEKTDSEIEFLKCNRSVNCVGSPLTPLTNH